MNTWAATRVLKFGETLTTDCLLFSIDAMSIELGLMTLPSLYWSIEFHISRKICDFVFQSVINLLVPLLLFPSSMTIISIMF